MRALAIVPLLMLGSHPASNEGDIQPIGDVVVKVDCTAGSGTAFRVGPTELISVAHVTGMTGCKIDGQPFTVTYRHGDFTALKMDAPAPQWLKIDCGGFVQNHHYIGYGFARGLDSETSVDVVATGAMEDAEEILVGIFEFQPGQSGGPVVDAGSGEVVGTVNAANWEAGASFSTPLSETRLCPKA